MPLIDSPSSPSAERLDKIKADGLRRRRGRHGRNGAIFAVCAAVLIAGSVAIVTQRGTDDDNSTLAARGPNRDDVCANATTPSCGTLTWNPPPAANQALVAETTSRLDAPINGAVVLNVTWRD